MKILVTKTAGFIGSHLAKKLLERGDEVVGIDNINDYYDVNLKFARLQELGINQNDIEDNKQVVSTIFPKHKFIKMELADTICSILDTKVPKVNSSYKDLITFVEYRAGHDRRYVIDATKLETELGWKADEDFDSGIVLTVIGI